MSIIGILTDPGKGGTFLTWSIHYLAGHADYYSVKTQCRTALPDNPVGKKNAHLFVSNQAYSYDTFKSYLGQLQNCRTDKFHTLYFHNFIELSYTPDSEFPETRQAIKEISDINYKIVLLTNQSKHNLYEKSYFVRESRMTDSESMDRYIKSYFGDSYNKWQELALHDIWDLREFLALNFRHHAISIAPVMDLSIDHFNLDCMEWFHTAENLIEPLFNYLELKLDLERYNTWIKIYQQWRKLHYQRMNFLWYFDKIINYIVQGYDMDLTRFNLDLVQEAAIQHQLIYQHNLNLKTFKLEKFINTSQLHELLEPNIHDLSQSLNF